MNSSEGSINTNDNYAAGKCISYDDGVGHSDWYLPALFEMGPASNVYPSGCNNDKNMVERLPFLIGDYQNKPRTSCALSTTDIDCLAGFYWSSTEYAIEPMVLAWGQQFDAGRFGGSDQRRGFKRGKVGVRCSRVLTP